jgi:hypothetical protein
MRLSPDLPRLVGGVLCLPKGDRQMTIRIFDWIYLTCKTPLWQDETTAEEQSRRQELANKVREAIDELTAVERIAIERHDFEGLSLVSIAAELGWSCSRVQAARRRALRRLRKELAPFVQERFGVYLPSPDCPICASKFRRDAERIIAARKQEEPYSKVISQLRRDFKIAIISPKTIIGHLKYHCQIREELCQAMPTKANTTAH